MSLSGSLGGSGWEYGGVSVSLEIWVGICGCGWESVWKFGWECGWESGWERWWDSAWECGSVDGSPGGNLGGESR